jgi:Fe-Mn family superoxide dismutase
MGKRYEARSFARLKGLQGISDGQLADHFKLYQGYVKNTNLLTEKLEAMNREGKAAGTEPAYAELTRRLGFEYNGMVLHEYYFENMAPGNPKLSKTGKLYGALGENFGGYDLWLSDFKAVATMRGVGWAILYLNPANGRLSNHWVEQHHDGNVAGFRPILVLDAWEHAFVPDYKPTERDKYVQAFMKNIAWDVIESRLSASAAGS